MHLTVNGSVPRQRWAARRRAYSSPSGFRRSQLLRLGRARTGSASSPQQRRRGQLPLSTGDRATRLALPVSASTATSSHGSVLWE